MNLCYVVPVATLFAFAAGACTDDSSKLHRLDFKTPAELHQFFSYKEGHTVISGHRGTVERGQSENSIEGMEAVLEHTPAFF